MQMFLISCRSSFLSSFFRYQAVIIVLPTSKLQPTPGYLLVVLYLLVLGDKLLDSLDVLLLGVGGAQVLVLLPLVVLGLAL